MIFKSIKSQFPIFSNNPGLVYLDSAATTQKPRRVIQKITDYYSKYNANVHRGLYPLSEKSTDLYEEARRRIAKFINADPEEIIFTSSATDGLNAIPTMLSNSRLIDKHPRIVLSELEHHSNIIPWQRINPKSLEYLMIDSDFALGSTSESKQIDIISLTHASNVTGTILGIKEILQRNNNFKFSVLDASQSIAHMKIDVKDLGIDFMVFSSHKIYGPTGVGVLYAKKDILNTLDPFRFGGGMINEVKRESASWADIPEKFEAGTPPIAQAIGLREAIDFVEEIGFEKIRINEQELRIYLIEKLKNISGIRIYHPPLNVDALGIVSFTIDGIHPHDLAQFLGERKICVRAGHHCTQILHREVLNIPASVRVSLGVYNTKDDIEKLIEGIKSAMKYYQLF
jgi:cysteine desulfurase/selenocysteine lyase